MGLQADDCLRPQSFTFEDPKRILTCFVVDIRF